MFFSSYVYIQLEPPVIDHSLIAEIFGGTVLDNKSTQVSLQFPQTADFLWHLC